MDQDKIFELNKKEALRNYRKEATCLFTGCTQPAINSHTYPNSFLKQISRQEDLLVLNLDELYCSRNEIGVNKLFTTKSSKKAAVEKLFCSSHDDKIFAPIEKSPLDTDIESYLYLYAYRLFIHEFYLEKIGKGQAFSPQVYEGTSFYPQFNENLKRTYISSEQRVANFLNVLSPHDMTCSVKEEFDRVFQMTNQPNACDFSKFFDLSNFKFEAPPSLLLSGIKTFKMPHQKTGGELPMVFFIVPTPDFKGSIFGIVSPTSERESFNFLKSEFAKSYKKYKLGISQNFILDVLFMLLDASENWVLTRSLYEQWEKDGSLAKMVKAWFCLAQGDFYKNSERHMKEKAWNLIRRVNYPAWLKS